MKSIFAVALLGAVAGTVLAAPGDFDPSFGSSGIATLAAGPWANRESEAAHVTSDAQGRILAIGSVPRPTGGPEGSVRVFARFLADGIADLSLAGTGYIDTVPDLYRSRAGLQAFPVADGKTLLIERNQGLCWPPRPACALADTTPFLFAQRIDAGGTIDPAYGVMATVSSDIAPQDAVTSPDGSLTSVGYQLPSLLTGSTQARFDVRGFDRFGQIYTPWIEARAAFDCGGQPVSIDRSAKMARHADGRLLLVQQVVDAAGLNRLCVSRLHPDATLDASYGTSGRYLLDSPLFAAGPAKILASTARDEGGAVMFLETSSPTAGRQFFTIWLTAGGALDTTHDGGIVGPFNGPIHFVEAVALQSDGKILLAGYPLLGKSKIPFPIADTEKPRIVRLDPSGVPDPGFGPTGEGYATLESSGRRMRPRHIHVGRENAIHVAGSIDEGSPSNPLSPLRFAVAKLLGDRPPGQRGGIWGSGCGAIRNAPLDPTLPAITLLAAALIFVRRRKSR